MSSQSENPARSAVFLSYASQDTVAAKRICETLRAAGVEVWFDQDELRGGDAWDRKIKKQIRECALFVPLISANTQARTEGYFRLEWHLAEQRSLLIAKGRAFIVPVGLDQTREGEALVPDAFLAVQWSRPGSDAKLAQVVAHVQRLLAGGNVARTFQSVGSANTGSKARATPDAPVVPDFELLRRIGRGSYGDVWLARSATGLWRAVKIVWRERFADAEPFEREWRGLKEFAAISLGESMQMALLHVGRNDEAGFFYYVMELADDAERGRAIDPTRYVPLTLAQLRTQRQRVPADECVRYGVELARALANLHGRGLVHRDIKPSNVILVNGAPKLADIGLVSPTTSAQTFVGTEGFVPPEGPGSPSADVFALGKVLYELATGLDRQEFPQLPEDLERLPDRRALFALNGILLRACEPQRDKRYRDAAALLADLTALQAGRPVQRPVRWLLAGAAVLAVAVAAVGIWQWPRPPVAQSTPPAQPQSPAMASKPTPATAPDRSLVVLPLVNQSPEPENAFFTDGMHSELIATLQRLPEVKVIARDSSLLLKPGSASLAELAKRVGVAHLITGSVRRGGGKVRIALELRRASDEALLWTKTYDRSLDDALGVQSEVADEVARVLQAREAKTTVAGARYLTKNPAALDAYLKAYAAMSQNPGVKATANAIALLEEVMRLDPNFAPAASELSQAHTHGYRTNPEPVARAKHLTEAKRWADEASRLLPGGAGDAALAYYYALADRDNGRALALADNVIRALPNDADVRRLRSIALAMAGRASEAADDLRRSIEFDPLNEASWSFLLQVLSMLRRQDEWQTAFTQVQSFSPAVAGESRRLEERFRLTGELPAEPEKMSPHARFEWLWRARKFALALADLEVTLVQPDLPDFQRFSNLFRKCDLLRRLGRESEAAECAQLLLPLAETLTATGGMNFSIRDGRLSAALLRLGRHDEAIAARIRFVEALSDVNRVSDRWSREINLAQMYAQAARPRECAERLAKLLRVPSGITVPMLRVDADYDAVRNDPAFQALLADPLNSAPLGVNGPIAPVPGVSTAPRLTATTRTVTPTATPAPKPQDDKSLVVLPFENLSPDPENSFFTDGMHAEVIATLSRIPELKVISRASALSLKGAALSLGDAAKKLDVTNVMSGSVRRAGKQIRIQLELRRASDEALLWSQTYAQELTDPFALQADIADNVARSLQARESKGAFGGARFTTKNPQAFDLFLKARGLFEIGDFRGDGMLEGAKLLKEALALDPSFVSAASLLTNLVADLARGSLDPAQRVAYAAEAKHYAEMATRLAPGGAGDAMLAFYYAVIEEEGAKALGLADNAVRALPNDAIHHNIRSIALARLGRVAEALAASRRACELDPHTPVFRTNELQALVALRRLEEFEAAIASDKGRAAAAAGLINRANYTLKGELPASLEGMGSAPTNNYNWLWLKRQFVEVEAVSAQVRTRPPVAALNRFGLLCLHHDVLIRLGRAEDAAQAAREAYEFAEKLQAVPEIGLSSKAFHLARALVRLGRHDEAIAKAKEYVEAASTAAHTGMRWRREAELAEIYAQSGKVQECVELLARLIRLPTVSITVPVLRLDPVWDAVRDDPRFKALLADPKNSAPL